MLLSLLLVAQFWVVQVPDTQHYSNSAQRYPHWPTMCAAVAAQPVPPVYVGHVGDYTQDAIAEQFARGEAAMALLGAIPWGVSIGNHDYDAGRKCTREGGGCTWNWRWWRGPENHTRVVSTPQGPLRFLHLEWLPSDDAIAWGRSVLDSDPTTPCVLITHYWLDRDGTHDNRYGTQLDGDGDNGPALVWRKLVDLYPQVWSVWCGDVHHVTHAQTLSVWGTRVLSFLFNTQDDPDGGQGFLRGYMIEPALLRVGTWSVSYTGRPPDRSEYWELPYDFAGHRRSLAVPVSRHTPVADTAVRSLYGGGRSFGADDLLHAERVPANEAVILIDFGAVPAPVERALLTLTLEGYGSDGAGVTIHRVLRPWSEADSWASLGGFLAGRDYEAAHGAEIGPHGPDTITVDVTDLVRGGLPYGLALAGRGDSSGIRSREWRAAAERPLLSVR